MLCDVTYEEAERAIPWRKRGHLGGTTTKQLREGGIKIGYTTRSTPEDRLKPLRGKEWKDIPDNSLVKVPHPKGPNFGWHWVAWRKGKIYDPARGVFTNIRFGDGLAVSYMQFIKENDNV
jgi:hypothetical protein